MDLNVLNTYHKFSLSIVVSMNFRNWSSLDS